MGDRSGGHGRPCHFWGGSHDAKRHGSVGLGEDEGPCQKPPLSNAMVGIGMEFSNRRQI